MKYPQLYQQYSQWTNIPSDQWLMFEAKLTERTIAKSEYFLQAGEQAMEFGIIISGIFRLYYTDKNGKEHIKTFRKAGDLLGAYAEMLMNIPSRTFIQAMESSKVLLISKDDFAPFYSKHVCWQILGRLAAEKHFINKEQREFEFLQLDVIERYKKFCDEFGCLLGKIPQHQIASYLGITPVALSRVLSKARKS